MIQTSPFATIPHLFGIVSLLAACFQPRSFLMSPCPSSPLPLHILRFFPSPFKGRGCPFLPQPTLSPHLLPTRSLAGLRISLPLHVATSSLLRHSSPPYPLVPSSPRPPSTCRDAARSSSPAFARASARPPSSSSSPTTPSQSPMPSR